MVKSDGEFPVKYKNKTKGKASFAGLGALLQGVPVTAYKNPRDPSTVVFGPAKKRSMRVPSEAMSIYDQTLATLQALKSEFDTESKKSTIDTVKVSAAQKNLIEGLTMARRLLTEDEYKEILKKIYGMKEGMYYTPKDIKDLVKSKVQEFIDQDFSNVVGYNKKFLRFVNDDLMELRNTLIEEAGVKYHKLPPSAISTTVADVVIADVEDMDVIDTTSKSAVAIKSISDFVDYTEATKATTSKNQNATKLQELLGKFAKEYDTQVKNWDDNSDKYYNKKQANARYTPATFTDGRRGRKSKAKAKGKKRSDGRQKKTKSVHARVIGSRCSSRKPPSRRGLKLLAYRSGLKHRKTAAKADGGRKGRKSKSKSKSRKADGGKGKSAWIKHVMSVYRAGKSKSKHYSLKHAMKAAKKSYRK